MRSPHVSRAIALLAAAGLVACGSARNTDCTSAADCDDRSACSTDSCVDGLCFHIANGNATPESPATEPCQKAVCLGGVRALVADDTHSPDDGVACTRDSCVGGKPVHAVDATSCGVAPACQKFQCDPVAGGATGCVLHDDSGHLPDDGFACTLDRCDGHTPVAVPQDGACRDRGAGKATCLVGRCDPTNQGADHDGCVLVPDDGACDDADGCTSDHCAPADAAADATTGCRHGAVDGAAPPVPGNCRAERCVAGASADVPDETDLPPDLDGLPCTVPSCAGGVPHEVPRDAACDDGLACTRDSCRAGQGCLHASTAGSCPAGTACDPSAPTATVPTGCVDADVCPPRLVAVPDLGAAADTTGTRDDFAPSCADATGHHPDLAFALTVTARSDIHAQIQANDGRGLALTLVEVANAACGRELLCAHHAGGTELNLLDVPAGQYALVVDGDGATTSAGPFELLVTLSPTALKTGDVVFTELMPDPALVDDTAGEYVELGNSAGIAITTVGLQLSKDGGATASALGGTSPWRVLAAGGFVVAARHADAATNGGIDASFVLPFGLANTPSEKLVLSKDGGPVLDALDLPAAGFPKAGAGRSFQLDPGALASADHDLYATWCLTNVAHYGQGDRGTPGLANERCHPECADDAGCNDQLPCTADRCVVGDCTHTNDDTAVPPDDGFSCTTSHCAAGVVVTVPDDHACDDALACTHDSCAGASGALVTGCSHAPDTTLCTTGMVCDAALGCVVPPVPADTCAGALPLTETDVPLDRMADDVVTSCGVAGTRDAFFSVTLPAAAHVSLAVQGTGAHAVALYAGSCGQLQELSCTATDKLELHGLAAGTYVVVVEGAPATVHLALTVTPGELAVGDMIVSEIMMDPAAPLDDSDAEWVELTNRRAFAVSTASVRLLVGTGAAVPVVQAATGRPYVVAPGGFLLAVRKADPAKNGGLTPDVLFTSSLANTGGTVQLKTAGGTVLDAVAYASKANGFPAVTAGRAFSLAPAAFADDLNDLGANWCLARPEAPMSVVAYDPTAANYGTPRAANPPCAP